jgi:hypothetical protein
VPLHRPNKFFYFLASVGFTRFHLPSEAFRTDPPPEPTLIQFFGLFRFVFGLFFQTEGLIWVDPRTHFESGYARGLARSADMDGLMQTLYPGLKAGANYLSPLRGFRLGSLRKPQTLCQRTRTFERSIPAILPWVRMKKIGSHYRNRQRYLRTKNVEV